jgi:hypothetical protein
VRAVHVLDREEAPLPPPDEIVQYAELMQLARQLERTDLAAARLEPAGCELCEAEELTWRYFEDDVLWVCDCQSCSTPMVVLKRHTSDPTPDERQAMEAALRQVADDEFGLDAWTLDTEQRAIPDHCHWHARPLPGFAEAA